MEFDFFVYSCVIWTEALKTITGLAATRKLCVEYRVSNSRMEATFLGIVHHAHKSVCLRQCGWLPKCSAYNYLKNGTCQLMSPTGDCNAPDELEGSSYIHLADCKGDIQRHADSLSKIVDTQCLICHRPQDDSVICTQAILKSPDNTTCTAIGARKGLYLPCWYKDGTFRMVSEEVESLKCNNLGLGSSFRWSQAAPPHGNLTMLETPSPKKPSKSVFGNMALHCIWLLRNSVDGALGTTRLQQSVRSYYTRYQAKCIFSLSNDEVFFSIRSYPNFYASRQL